MQRALMSGLLVCGLALMSIGQAFAQQTCKPILAFTQVHYSGMQLPKLERAWTGVLSVDASSCLTSSGRFVIVYSMEQENVLDYEVREEYLWKPGKVEVTREFWIDEAVAAYRVDSVAPCPCRK